MQSVKQPLNRSSPNTTFCTPVYWKTVDAMRKVATQWIGMRTPDLSA